MTTLFTCLKQAISFLTEKILKRTCPLFPLAPSITTQQSKNAAKAAKRTSQLQTKLLKVSTTIHLTILNSLHSDGLLSWFLRDLPQFFSRFVASCITHAYTHTSESCHTSEKQQNVVLGYVIHSRKLQNQQFWHNKFNQEETRPLWVCQFQGKCIVL